MGFVLTSQIVPSILCSGKMAMTIQVKRLSTSVDLVLKIGTALLMTFAATLVLIHAQLYFDRSLTTQQHYLVVLTSNDQH